ncbi:hypothetical protein [Plasticicumulans sp.]
MPAAAAFTQTGGSVFVQSASLGLYVNGSYRLNDTDGQRRSMSRTMP